MQVRKGHKLFVQVRKEQKHFVQIKKEQKLFEQVRKLGVQCCIFLPTLQHYIVTEMLTTFNNIYFNPLKSQRYMIHIKKFVSGQIR